MLFPPQLLTQGLLMEEGPNGENIFELMFHARGAPSIHENDQSSWVKVTVTKSLTNGRQTFGLARDGYINFFRQKTQPND